MDEAITLVYILQNLGLTVFFVGLIGFERQRKHKIAGMTTHVLVALGAAALTILSKQMMYDTLELAKSIGTDVNANIVVENTRIIAGVITGVGFLGTGAILKTNSNVYGLTTASTLWISAIIGIVFGMNYVILGVVTSVFALLALTLVKRVFAHPIARYQVENETFEDDE
ncbi:MAG: putative Mg(2+) transport ATPase [Candidatus Izimaplasma bacterium HR2]|nr:MAG: putative Mg(2+) transport ATPase [Candidatus Izimaplasma bacterium HR2]